MANLGAWSFNLPKTAPTPRVPLWASALKEGEKDVLQGLKSAKVLQQSITALFFPIHISCFCLLAAALKRFHENSEAEQVGVVAPGVGTAKHDEDATQEGFSVIYASAAYTHCQAVIINTC